MGIDFLTYSKINPDMYKEDDPHQYLKYALRDIEWFKILDLLDIYLANNTLNYWCPEQVEDIYNRIKNITNKIRTGINYRGYISGNL